jgi:hypothetical protein
VLNSSDLFVKTIDPPEENLMKKIAGLINDDEQTSGIC